jgi:hypothetical protein
MDPHDETPDEAGASGRLCSPGWFGREAPPPPEVAEARRELHEKYGPTIVASDLAPEERERAGIPDEPPKLTDAEKAAARLWERTTRADWRAIQRRLGARLAREVFIPIRDLARHLAAVRTCPRPPAVRVRCAPRALTSRQRAGRPARANATPDGDPEPSGDDDPVSAPPAPIELGGGR